MKITKQHIGNLFLLLAGFVFSIHIVVPHHHHNEQICVGGSFYHSDIFPHNHNTDSANHQHAGDEANNCILQQSYNLPVNSGRYDIVCDINCKDLHNHDYVFAAISSLPELPVPQEIIASAPPEISLKRNESLSISFGLRAPPVA